jgi:hypothetical protein
MIIYYQAAFVFSAVGVLTVVGMYCAYRAMDALPNRGKPLICHICGTVYGTCPHTK